MNLGEFDPGHQGLYVDLDALFDTRLACLEFIDRDLALTNLREGWIVREMDAPKFVDAEIYRKIYAMRDEHILELASSTNIHIALLDWLSQAACASVKSPRPVSTHIFVNFWPYRISKDVAIELGDKIAAKLNHAAPVTIINIPPAKLTFALCDKYFSCMYKYDWRDWLETIAQSGEINKRQIPSVTLYVPKLYDKTMPTKADYDRKEETNMDFFTEAEFFCGRIIGLEFVDAQFFSSSLPTNSDDLVKAYTSMTSH